MDATLNPTIKKFYSDERFIFQSRHWLAVTRPSQVTLGSIVLMSKSDSTSIGSLSDEEGADLIRSIKEIEHIFQKTFQPEKINYLALMMVDPNPHFHIIPRYQNPREFIGRKFVDMNWPSPPDLAFSLQMSDVELAEVSTYMRNHSAFIGK
ncbi:HIT family protein [Microvirga sp. P5_D2]